MFDILMAIKYINMQFIKFSVRRLMNLSTTWLAGFDHHAYKSEQRREVIKRVSVFLKKIQNPKPLI